MRIQKMLVGTSLTLRAKKNLNFIGCSTWQETPFQSPSNSVNPLTPSKSNDKQCKSIRAITLIETCETYEFKGGSNGTKTAKNWPFL